MILNEEECLAAGLDPKEVARIARRIERAARDASNLGLTVFGGAHSGDLRFHDDDRKGPLICAWMDGSWDGGDGGSSWSDHGLKRGEYE